jgi:hypothetical protein
MKHMRGTEYLAEHNRRFARVAASPEDSPPSAEPDGTGRRVPAGDRGTPSRQRLAKLVCAGQEPGRGMRTVGRQAGNPLRRRRLCHEELTAAEVTERVPAAMED